MVGEALGAEEEDYGRPLIGPSGHESYRMFEESGWTPHGSADYIIRNLHPWYDHEQHRMRISNPNFLPLDKTLDEASIFITNICHSRPPGNEIARFFATKTEAKRDHIPLVCGRYPTESIQQGIDQLRRDIETIRPTIIIALGGTALWALTGLEGITKWRGSILKVENGPVGNFGIKVIPTFHPADVLREWPHRFIAIRDLKRAYIERQYSEVREKTKHYIIRPGFAEAIEWIEEQSQPALAEKPLGADIETPWGWWNLVGHIACIGFSTSRSDAICVPLMCVADKEGYWPPDREVEIVLAIRRLMTTRPLIFHNGVFDVMHIIRHWGFLPRWTDDTMVMQHVRFPGLMGSGKIDPVTGKETKKGSSRSLVFCASMYCEHHRAWKDEGKNWNQKEVPDEDGWWSYNCLSKGTVIITDQGHKTINEIVSKKTNVKVLSMNESTRCIEWKKITGWHRTFDRSTKWMRIILNESNGGRHENSLVATPEHEIIGPIIGRKRVDKLQSGDKIFAPDIDWGELYDNALMGTLLGDFVFGKTSNQNIYVQGSHNKDVGLALILEKQRLFGGEFGTSILKEGQGFTSEDTESHKLYIPVSLQLKRLYNTMVDSTGTKRPSLIMDKISMLGLALWYMDDGFIQKIKQDSRNRNSYCCLSLHRYPDDEKQFVADWFSKQFGHSSVSTNGRLNMGVEASRNFCWLIGPYVIPEYRYKLCFPAPEYEPTKLMEKAYPSVYTVKSVETFDNSRNGTFGYKYTRYCLSVEDNHNFFTIHGLVSNCDDTSSMYEVFEVLRDALQRENLWRQYRFSMSRSGPALDMMMRGFPLDHDLLDQYKTSVRQGVQELEQWINDVCGHEVNTGSSPQMQKLFYEDLGMKKVMKGRGRAARPTLDDGALETIAKRSPVLGPLCYAISNKQSLLHFKNNMLSIRLPDDGRAHTGIDLAGTDTLRIRSSGDCFGTGLNMQNINRMPSDD